MTHRTSRHRAFRKLTAATASIVLLTCLTAPSASAVPFAEAPAITAESIHPAPQEFATGKAAVPLKGPVTLVVGGTTDPAAITATKDILSAAGATVTTKVVTSAADAATVSGNRVIVGTTADNPGVAPALGTLKVADAAGLTAEGYVVTTGTDNGAVAVLNGKDGAGTFYAAQTLRQITVNGEIASVSIRDWPLMPIRGSIEGFYGIPWSHQARLDHFTHYGQQKLNTYIYTPKDDPLLRSKWREKYTGDDLARISELVKKANANHVHFTFALSPANDLCYSSEADFKATTDKFDQLRALGVSSFYIALDDIPLKFHCESDKQKYPNTGNWYWLADAQTDYLNKLQRDYIEPKGLPALQTVPTNYNGSKPDPYKGRFGDRLDKSIRVQWTGEGVFSDTVTVDSVQQAKKTYRSDHFYIWDNFPVNDDRRGRIYLMPLSGRDPDLYKYLDGFTANPMIEPYTSLPSLYNYADYTWNAPKYQPKDSLAWALDKLAGPNDTVRAALADFADLNQDWPHRKSSERAPKLGELLDAYTSKQPGAQQSLLAHLAMIEKMPAALANMAEKGFYTDSLPWITLASQWAKAVTAEIAMIDAMDAGNPTTAKTHAADARRWLDETTKATVDDVQKNGTTVKNAIVPTVGDGRFESFSKAAMKRFCDANPADPSCPPVPLPAEGTSSMGTYGDNTLDKMFDWDMETAYWSDQAPKVGSWVQADLGKVTDIESVKIYQGNNDKTLADGIYHGRLEVSDDATTWRTLGTYDNQPVVAWQTTAPIKARYVRYTATAENESGKWVRIREFQVFAPQPKEKPTPTPTVTPQPTPTKAPTAKPTPPVPEPTNSPVPTSSPTPAPRPPTKPPITGH